MISLNSFNDAPESRTLDMGFMSKPFAELTPDDRGNLQDYHEQTRALEFQAVEDAATALKGGMPYLPVSLCLLAGQYSVRNELVTFHDFTDDPVFKLLEKAWNQDFQPSLLDLAATHLETEHSTLPRQKPKNMPDQKAWDVLETNHRYLVDLFRDPVTLDPGEATLKLRLHARVFPPRHQQSNPWWVMATTVGIMLQWAEEGLSDDAGLPKALAYSPRCASALNHLQHRWKAGAATFEEIEAEHTNCVAAHSRRLMHLFCRKLSCEMHEPLLADAVDLTTRPKTSYDLTRKLEEAGYRDLGSALSWGNETPELYTAAQELFLPVSRVWLSGSSHHEIHVCHHLKFFFTVESD
jgi:hypothetical protein